MEDYTSFNGIRFHCSKPFTEKHPFTGAFFIQESEDDMGVRVVFPDMGKDPSIQLIEKTITENGTYDATTDGANGYSKVNVNVEGGGGSSDFSTAEVTFSSTVSGKISWDNCPTLVDNMLSGSLYIDSLPTTIIVPLYKGKCIWEHGTSALTLSGNIEPYYDGMLITGDCAIVTER